MTRKKQSAPVAVEAAPAPGGGERSSPSRCCCRCCCSAPPSCCCAPPASGHSSHCSCRRRRRTGYLQPNPMRCSASSRTRPPPPTSASTPRGSPRRSPTVGCACSCRASRVPRLPVRALGVARRAARRAPAGHVPGSRRRGDRYRMAAVTSYVLLDFADEIIAQRPDAIVIYTGHNEYLGIGGVGSSFASARSPPWHAPCSRCAGCTCTARSSGCSPPSAAQAHRRRAATAP